MSVVFVRVLNIVLPLFISAIFLDSLRHKFFNTPEIQIIFGRLNMWSTDLGLPGLFSQTGLFSQYVIGSAELLAAVCLLLGFIPNWDKLRSVGAIISFVVMTAAINFHLFTPLGIDPHQDGGGLFLAACMLWLFSATLLITNRKDVLALVPGLKQGYQHK